MGSSKQVAHLFPSPLVSAPSQPPPSQDKNLLHTPGVSRFVGPLLLTIPPRRGQSKATFCEQTPPSWSPAAPSKPPVHLGSAPAAPAPSIWGLCSLLNWDSSTSCHHKFPSQTDHRVHVGQHTSFPFQCHWESPTQFAQTNSLVKCMRFMPNNTDFRLPRSIHVRGVVGAKRGYGCLPGHCSCSRQRMHQSLAPRISRYHDPFC